MFLFLFATTILFPGYMEYLLNPVSNATLRALLSNPINKWKNSKEGKKSLRKFHSISSDIVRPGYSSDSQFACRHCGKRYRWKSTMRRHEQVECGGKEPSFQCPQCPYKAKQKGNLGVHIRKHHQSVQDVLNLSVKSENLSTESKMVS